MKKMYLLGMMMLILSTAFISCGKITDDPDPEKPDSTLKQKDSILIEVTIKTTAVTELTYISFMVLNNALTGGYFQQTPTLANVFTIKITGKDAATLIGKESRVGLLITGAINGHGCQWKLLNGDTDGGIPITLKKGLNKVTFEYETWLML